MSHVINYWDYPAEMEEKAVKDTIYCEIYDAVECEYPDEEYTECGYHGMARCAEEIIFKNKAFDNRKQAYEYLHSQPSYCNMAVKFKDRGRLMYLVRTEYHC